FQFEGKGWFPINPAAYSGTAALGYGGNTFNNILLPGNYCGSYHYYIFGFDAMDSLGFNSTVSLTLRNEKQIVFNSGPPADPNAPPNDGFHADPNAPQTLLCQFIYGYYFAAAGTIGTFTLSNLPPNAAYKLYLYGGDGSPGAKGTLFNVSGGTAD